MLRDLTTGVITPSPLGPSSDQAVTSGLLVTHRGWRPQDWLERAVLAGLQRMGPLHTGPRLAVYAGFPWSALIDTVEQPGQFIGPYLRAQVQYLAVTKPAKSIVVTCCQHPHVLAHLEVFAEAGVTDLFWTGTPPEGDAGLHAGVRLHRLPALPEPGRAGPQGAGPGAAFAFCSAENGGNTPDLWAAIFAGLLPVLPKTGRLSLPGPQGLWDQALLRLSPAEQETALAQVLADQAAVQQRREALAALALLARPENFVAPLLEALQGQGGGVPAPLPASSRARLPDLVRELAPVTQLSVAQAERVFDTAALDLLREREGAIDLMPSAVTAAAWRLFRQARLALPKESTAEKRFSVLQERRRTTPRLVRRAKNRPSVAGLRTAAPLKVYLLGRRGQRTPLSYAPMWPQMQGLLTLVERPEEADLLVTGWSRDFEEHGDLLASLWQRNIRPRLVVLSEEPLWDSLWSDGLSPRDRVITIKGHRMGYRVLSHVTSDIFAFEHLPWFILSDPKYTARQAQLIAGFAALAPQELLAHWHKAPLQAAFVAERRLDEDYAAEFPLEEVWGLSRYRSRIAEQTHGAAVLRLGQGWPGPEGAAPPRRQDIPDWHLDKLARLHGQVRICAAYENTLQRDYITEKPFDAFAMGALPAVMAPPGHRLHELILPEAMINTAGLTPDMAAAWIGSLRGDLIQAEAWLETAHGLKARLCDLAGLNRERQRIIETCAIELALALAEPPEQSLLDRAA